MEGPPLLGRTPQLSGSFFHRGTPLEPCPELSLKMFTMKKPAHLCLQLGNSSVHVSQKNEHQNKSMTQMQPVHNSSQLVCWAGLLCEREICTFKHQEE